MKSRPLSSRILCSSHLRQIGLAIKMYANENDQWLPPSLGVVAATQAVTAGVFVCPAAQIDGTFTAATVPPTTNATTQGALGRQIDDPAGHHCSYFYAGRGLRDDATLDPDGVLAFEPPSDHGDVGINLLFADGHVDWQPCYASDPAYQRLYADYAAGKRPLRWAP